MCKSSSSSLHFMEVFNKTMAVNFIATTTSTSWRKTSARRSARAEPTTTWMIEAIEERPHTIRLRSVHGTYRKGVRRRVPPLGDGEEGPAEPHNQFDRSIDWGAVRDGFKVRMRSWCGKFHRANGGKPVWRNSSTHDDPQRSAPKNWIPWDAEAVDSNLEHGKSLQGYGSPKLSSNSYGADADVDLICRMSGSGLDSPRLCFFDNYTSQKQLSPSISTAMEFFQNAKAVRLRSHHNKYLIAEEDEESVILARNGSSPSARWSVEYVLNSDSIIRLRSRYGKYLTAFNQPFLLGMTGHKVLQTLPRRLDSSVEWEPVRDGTHVCLKTRYGNFLRANGGLLPWRNSVTHDVPHLTSTQEWILWDVDVVEIKVQSPTGKGLVNPISPLDSLSYEEPGLPPERSNVSERYSRQESTDSYVGSPPKSQGRKIYYHIAGENGEIEGEDMEGFAMLFEGTTVEELTKKLEEETGIHSIFVCSRSPLNGKLFPLRLQLPPNIVTMHVIVVPQSSVAAGDFSRQ